MDARMEGGTEGRTDAWMNGVASRVLLPRGALLHAILGSLRCDRPWQL